ncbi:hypothetical protein [Glycomyces sp. NPDC047010]|uniref:hypothetical protein n=1 Tax=Glycomyces sp. NPDC047010 TaxID=3155023 RepID=UPI003409B4FB
MTEVEPYADVFAVEDGPAAGMKLCYTAFPGTDEVTVTDPGSRNALVAVASGITAFDYPRLVFEPGYFDLLNYDRKTIRDNARAHYEGAMCERSVL